jgi:hypothetical protein
MKYSLVELENLIINLIAGEVGTKCTDHSIPTYSCLIMFLRVIYLNQFFLYG